MEKATKFYIHIQSDTLAHFLVRGIFCPSRFLNNKNRDIQDQYDSFLLLSDKQWNDESDCSIEVHLLEEDIAQLMQIQDNYFVLGNCLPISRLVKIHFSDMKKAENVIWNINQGAAFVPDWAVSYQFKSKQDTVELIGQHSFSEVYSENALKTKMERYDRLMGGFSFLKVGQLNSAYNTLDTTVSYLSAVAYFNTYIKSEIEANKINLNRHIQAIFSGENEIYKYLAKPVSFEDVTALGKKENQKVLKSFNTIKFDAIEPKSLTYKLAILHTYGKGKGKSDNDLVSGLLSSSSSKLVEELALVFGLHSGYSTLRNKYSNTKTTIDTKFKLENVLEFYLIESLYNYVFKDHRKSDRIDFLENLTLKNQVKKTPGNFYYLKILGQNYSYEKQERVIIEKDSLTSMLLNTIKDWCQKNDAKLNEENLLTKLGKSIIPEIRTVITSNKKELIVKKPKLLSKKEIKKVTSNKPTTKQESLAKSKKGADSRLKSSKMNEPSLFPELESNEVELNVEKTDQMTIAQLEKKTVTDLKALCKEKGYKKYSKLNREDLIKFILSQ